MTLLQRASCRSQDREHYDPEHVVCSTHERRLWFAAPHERRRWFAPPHTQLKLNHRCQLSRGDEALVECIVAYRVLVTRCLCQFTYLLKHEALGGTGAKLARHHCVHLILPKWVITQMRSSLLPTPQVPPFCWCHR